MFQHLIRQIDNEKKHSLYLLVFLLTWFTVNLIQSALTELAHDEAYYWMYSRNLAWGYFDHPPMIALLIKAGYSLFPSEVGVRLFTTLMGTMTIFLIYRLIDVPKKSLFLYILIVYSIILVHSHVGGFLAIPDIPLLFFTALFFLVYKNYLENDSYKLSLMLAIVAALMLYSKYHGILILIFTLVFNISIAKRRSFWAIPIVIFILLLPHLFWQINNGFPTFRYHLVSRSSTYHIEHTINFLYSQFLIAGPLVSVFILYKSFRYKPESVYERVMKVNFVCIFIFFFLSSLRGHVEAHWTAIAYIPMLPLVYKASMHSTITTRWLKRLFLPSILFFFLIRLLLVSDVINFKPGVLKEFHGWRKWTQQIDSVAQGSNVVFVNSFQRPSKYTFYSHGKLAHSLNNIRYRKNQYDIWRFEDSLQHRPALLVQSRQPDDTLYSVIGEDYPYQFVHDFVSYNNLTITIDRNEFTIPANQKISTRLSIINSRNADITFRSGDRVVAIFYKKKKKMSLNWLIDLKTMQLSAKGTRRFKVEIPVPAEIGRYQMYISIITSNLSPAINCAPVKVDVK